MAASGNNLKVSAGLLARLEQKAAAEGRSVDEVAEEAISDSLAEKSWQALLARGRNYGEASGVPEEQVPDTVQEWRNDQRRR